MGLNTTPRTWATNEVVTAAELNAEIRDALTGIQAAWTDFSGTIAWTATTTNPALNTGGVMNARYRQIGKTVDFYVQISMGSGTTYGSGTWLLSLPVTAAQTRWEAPGTAFDTSASAEYPIWAVAESTTSLAIRTLPGTAGNPFVSVGLSSPMTWANGDVLTISGTYEAA